MHRSALVALVTSVALMGQAGAVAGVAPTNLTIHADDAHVYGKLTGRPSCRDGQTIELVLDGVEIATATTGPDGRYSFDYGLVPPAEIRARFGGSTSGVHPDTLICTASISRVLRFVPGAGSARPSGPTPPTGPDVGGAAISVGTAIRATLATWLQASTTLGAAV